MSTESNNKSMLSVVFSDEFKALPEDMQSLLMSYCEKGALVNDLIAIWSTALNEGTIQLSDRLKNHGFNFLNGDSNGRLIQSLVTHAISNLEKLENLEENTKPMDFESMPIDATHYREMDKECGLVPAYLKINSIGEWYSWKNNDWHYDLQVNWESIAIPLNTTNTLQ